MIIIIMNNNKLIFTHLTLTKYCSCILCNSNIRDDPKSGIMTPSKSNDCQTLEIVVSWAE